MWDWMQGAGTLIGGLSTAYGGIEMAKQNKKMNAMNEKIFNQNEQYYKDSKKIKDKVQFNFDSAVSEVYGTDDEKDKSNALLSLGV